LRSMEETGLSADITEIAATCRRVARLFRQAEGIEVTFSTGHTCYFDISDHKQVFEDNGLLHPGTGRGGFCLSNLPAGEVYTCPNEAADSQTCGESPVYLEGETLVFVIRNNQVVDIQGKGPVAEAKRLAFQQEPALRNVAEVCIGCNRRAVSAGSVTNVLQDLKAGFTWANGLSDFIGGRVGVADFSSPDKVFHQDLVYAQGNPVHCQRFEFVLPDGTRLTAIEDGVRRLWDL